MTGLNLRLAEAVWSVLEIEKSPGFSPRGLVLFFEKLLLQGYLGAGSLKLCLCVLSNLLLCTLEDGLWSTIN